MKVYLFSIKTLNADKVALCYIWRGEVREITTYDMCVLFRDGDLFEKFSQWPWDAVFEGLFVAIEPYFRPSLSCLGYSQLVTTAGHLRVWQAVTAEQC